MSATPILLDADDVLAHSISGVDELPATMKGAAMVNPNAPLHVLLAALQGRLTRMSASIVPATFGHRGDVPVDVLEDLLAAVSEMICEAKIIGECAVRAEHTLRRAANAPQKSEATHAE